MSLGKLSKISLKQIASIFLFFTQEGGGVKNNKVGYRVHKNFLAPPAPVDRKCTKVGYHLSTFFHQGGGKIEAICLNENFESFP